MKKNLILLAICLASFFSDAQPPQPSGKLTKTYYDYLKTHIHEEYYVNSAGEQNGPYKQYTESGIVAESGTFQRAKQHGVWTTFIVHTGRQQLKSKETYDNGVLNGPASYYDLYDPETNGPDYFGGLLPGVVTQSGNYVNGLRDGAWTFIEKNDDPLLEAVEGVKGDYIKWTSDYRNDVRAPKDGKFSIHYYPSGTLHTECEYKDSKLMGEKKIYRPDGKLSSITIYGEGAKVWMGKNDKGNPYQMAIDYKLYWPNGQLREHKWIAKDEEQYEGYDEKGNQDNKMIRLNQPRIEFTGAKWERNEETIAIEPINSGDSIIYNIEFVNTGKSTLEINDVTLASSSAGIRVLKDKSWPIRTAPGEKGRIPIMCMAGSSQILWINSNIDNVKIRVSVGEIKETYEKEKKELLGFPRKLSYKLRYAEWKYDGRYNGANQKGSRERDDMIRADPTDVRKKLIYDTWTVVFDSSYLTLGSNIINQLKTYGYLDEYQTGLMSGKEAVRILGVIHRLYDLLDLAAKLGDADTKEMEKKLKKAKNQGERKEIIGL